jgi:hypothetical protein
MDSDLTQEELEAEVEAFMRRQAEIESGKETRKAEPGKVLGADEVSEEVSSLCAGAQRFAVMRAMSRLAECPTNQSWKLRT